ncbi:hypothetical protein [Bradyrhizobium sp. 6(2017)]|uniref:hypothetical protein n=1 Tax=Bradyrhizobium sp. 6(2017) TaxID=1197460 RepID=UPI0039C892CF
MLAGKVGDPDRSGVDNRLFVNGVVGSAVRRLTGSTCTCRSAMASGTACLRGFPLGQSGVWEKVFAELIRDRDNKYLMLDTTLVRVHQQAASGEGGQNSRTRALRRWFDDQDPHALQRPRSSAYMLMAGQRHGNLTTKALLEGFEAGAVLADRAYDYNDVCAKPSQTGTPKQRFPQPLSQGPDPPRRNDLQAEKPHRALLNKLKTLPPLRYAIRPTGRTSSRLSTSPQSAFASMSV